MTLSDKRLRPAIVLPQNWWGHRHTVITLQHATGGKGRKESEWNSRPSHYLHELWWNQSRPDPEHEPVPVTELPRETPPLGAAPAHRHTLRPTAAAPSLWTRESPAAAITAEKIIDLQHNQTDSTRAKHPDGSRVSNHWTPRSGLVYSAQCKLHLTQSLDLYCFTYRPENKPWK